MNLGSLLNLTLNLVLNPPPRTSRFMVRGHGACANATSHRPRRVIAIPPLPVPGIPTGFRPKARGWTASRAYPGWEIPRIHNPIGVAPAVRNPVGVGSNTRPTRGSSFLATPGFGSQSLRDWKPPMLPPRFKVREPVDFEHVATHEPAQGGPPRAARRVVSTRSASGATSSTFMVPIRVQFWKTPLP